MNNNRDNVMKTFERMFGSAYSAQEKYFYLLLRDLWLFKKNDEGWLLFMDSEKGREKVGFRSYGLSARICKSARQKLKQDGLIECRYIHGPKGYRIGTAYKLIDEKFETSPKAIHAAIMGRIGGRVTHCSILSQ